MKPESVIGRNTVASMQSGKIFGFAGQVEEILRRMKEDLHGKPRVVATGGLAETIAGESSQIDEVNPYLTLTGLRILWDRNHAS